MEIKETGLDRKGRQRRALISLGVIGALSAAARALVGKIPKVEAEREKFYRQTEAAKRAKKAADKASQAAAAELKEKYAVKPQPSKEVRLSSDIRKEQEEEFGKILREKMGRVEVRVEPISRPYRAKEGGLRIRILPHTNARIISAFSEGDKTPPLLSEVRIYDDAKKMGYVWGVFRYQDFQKQVLDKNIEPTVETSFWGRVVFACRKEGDRVYMEPILAEP